MTTATSITVWVPLAIRHQPGRKTIVTPMTNGVAPVTTRADPTLVKAHPSPSWQPPSASSGATWAAFCA